ncbi:hypothetical protein EN858_18560 [Mesorhizobium sp. M4B.F.Ca.ET.215.01.1.1]|uniref:Uncharacterized protein n=1 Tax=Mesorhizobium abyssinicae TaxID=1209958 RepID=A0ABU5AJD5_9HYPH|nr:MULTISPECIES: hypothetical protein [Mesorhizobium]RVD12595.1 hypothetical protein EN738_34865 [Mesorhizobium sp. M4B.F.Ca.ET.017.02.2.1]MDX8537399.1 hypothetical protein [Mesorhizobium abyssinicae]RUW19114.1 hypothetical protein EOA34_30455 [Mesorhizobium sp. M4B.F.Ca.ET.013.02.1.1]RVD36120.1 hypothetical protein EN741_26385 [Mesorhizobium sp. M4B.F.Ca.ET.019.03.1.1]RWF62728.1 MAG: hypothetical protein EOS47_22265 [Mesorhizobium sp.]
MRLFWAIVLLMTRGLFSAARGEERIALVVAGPAGDGAPAVAVRIAASLRQIGFAVGLLSHGEDRTGPQSSRPSLREQMPTETNSAPQGLGTCAPKLLS